MIQSQTQIYKQCCEATLFIYLNLATTYIGTMAITIVPMSMARMNKRLEITKSKHIAYNFHWQEKNEEAEASSQSHK